MKKHLMLLAFALIHVGTIFSQTDYNIMRSLGPNNWAGRMQSVAVRQGDEIWAGAHSGGIWRSFTAGAGKKAWSRITSAPPEAQSVGAIAFDPNNSDFVIIGTGLQDLSLVRTTFSFQENLGGGIFWSEDGGATWNKSSLDKTLLVDASVNDIAFYNIEGKTRIFAATTDGLYCSDDMGKTFIQKSHYESFLNVCVDPITGYIYASCGTYQGVVNTNRFIMRSIDHGDNFQPIKTCYKLQDPKDPNSAQIESAMSKPRIAVYNNVLYCMTIIPTDNPLHATFTDIAPGELGLEAIYRSDNAGERDPYKVEWKMVFDGSKPGNDILGSIGWHVGAITINPKNTDIVYIGGVNFWRSDDGAQSFTKLSISSGNNLKNIPDEGEPYLYIGDKVTYAHPDITKIVIDNANDRIFITTDGGVFATKDEGKDFMDFQSRNGRLITTQIYQGFANGINSDLLPPVAHAGLQDNGTLEYFRGLSIWKRINRGDGGWNAFRYKKTGPKKDELDDGISFGCTAGFDATNYTYYPKMFRSVYGNLTDEINLIMYNNIKPLPHFEFPMPFIYAQEPNLDAIKPGTLYAGSDYIWKSTDDGNTWTKTGRGLVDQLFPQGCASFMAVSPVDGSKVIVSGLNNSIGNNSYYTYYTTNGGASWTESNLSKTQKVTDICFDHTNSKIAYVTITEDGDCVWKTTDGGATWKNIVNSTMWGKNGNAYAVCVDPYNPNILWIGSTNSLYIFDQATQELTNWFDLHNMNSLYWTKNAGAFVTDITVADYGLGEKRLRISTFGNGVFELSHAPVIATGDFTPQPLPFPNPPSTKDGFNTPPIQLELKMKTRGWSTLEEQTVTAKGEYNWSINGKLQTPARWNGIAQPYSANTVSTTATSADISLMAENILGYLTIEPNQVDTIKIWRSMVVDGFDYKPSTVDTMIFVINANDYYYPAKSGSYTSTSMSNTNKNLLSGNSVLATYPNPFSQATTINYQIPASGQVSLKVFDMAGKEVTTLLNGVKPAGKYQTVWNAENVTSGMYYITLKSGAYSTTQKLQVVK